MRNKENDGVLRSYTEIICIASMILVITISSLSLYAHADTINPGVFPKDSSPFGISYKDWISRWWQWNAGIPAAVHPRDNYSPEKCTIHQSGTVWFLPDILTGKEERTCTIPAGKAILVPLLTGSCWDDHTDPKLRTDAGFRQCALQGNEYGAISAMLDGRNLQNLQQYRTMSGYYNLTIPKENTFNSMPGTFKAIADGFFVFLEPLSPGKHDLQLKTSVSNPIAHTYDYSAEAIYHLIVK